MQRLFDGGVSDKSEQGNYSRDIDWQPACQWQKKPGSRIGIGSQAAADQVPRLMREFEQGPLRDYTPCRFDAIQEREEALAVVNAELILIHPFREGNGRCARVLATLMALQAELPPLDFSGVQGRKGGATLRRYTRRWNATMSQ